MDLKTQEFLGGRVVVKVGDITEEDADAVVNAANSSLLGGGGVDGAIHRGGGPDIMKQCREIRRTKLPNGLPTGKVVLTTAGNMKARWVIHTVGPVYGRSKGKDAELLGDCYRNALSLAKQEGLRTIAFPAISTGIYGYPPAEAAKVVSAAIKEFLSADDSIRQVRLVFFSLQEADVFLQNHLLTPAP